MSRHNKKRNTVFLYEALVREIVKHTLNKDIEDRDKAIAILKEHFSLETEIGKELRLFKTLLETKGVSPRVAEKLIQEAKKSYKNLNKEKVFQEQSALIKRINKDISKSVFSNFVPNYRDLATLSQIFGEDLSVKKKVILEESILQNITSKKDMPLKPDKINNLVVNKFIDKFNDKYNKELFENQKTLLNKFILSFVDGGVDFKLYLNEEIENIKNIINESFKLDEIKSDKNMLSKMKEVHKLLEMYKREPVNEGSLQQFLKIQALTVEIKS